MAQNIYDEDGKKVGTIKSEKEAAEDEHANFLDNVGCLLILVIVVLAFILVGPWIAQAEGEVDYSLGADPIIIATIVAGRMIIVANKLSLWGAFWRVALIDVGVGTVGSMLAQLVQWGYLDGGKVVDDVIISIQLAILPAFIVTMLFYRKKRKVKKFPQKMMP